MARFGVPDWDGAVEALASADSIAIACHVNPDGDALGSLLGFSLGMRSLGKSTAATWPTDVIEMPPGYGFLPGRDALVLPSELPEADIYVALDCGAGDRLGMLEDTFRGAAVSVNVDHHPGNDGFAKFNLVVDSASSTAELVTRLLQDLDVEIDRDIAMCLYTGVVTDTGNFQYANAKPDTLRLAADLLDLGVPKTEIAEHVYGTAPFDFLHLAGRVLERAELIRDKRFIYSVVTRADLESTGVRMEETDALIDLLRSTRDADVTALFKEQAAGGFRVSLRAKLGHNVGEIARANGGGGHDLAAGFTTEKVEDAVADISGRLT